MGVELLWQQCLRCTFLRPLPLSLLCIFIFIITVEVWHNTVNTMPELLVFLFETSAETVKGLNQSQLNFGSWRHFSSSAKSFSSNWLLGSFRLISSQSHVSDFSINCFNTYFITSQVISCSCSLSLLNHLGSEPPHSCSCSPRSGFGQQSWF